jgi:MFS family permease
MSSTTEQSPFAVLQVRAFKHFIAGRFLFIMGLRMLGTAIAWWMYELTRDAFYIGMIGLAEAIPAVSLALYSGYIIDKSEKRKMLLTGMILYLVCVLALLATSYGFDQQGLSQKLVITFVYIIIFATGMIRSFTGPTFHAIIAGIVPRPMLSSASQWSSSTWLVGSITGHALAGFLIAWLSVSGTLLVVAVFVLSGILILRSISPQPPVMQSEKRTLAAVSEGLRYVFNNKDLLGAISLDLFAVLFGGAVAMVPVFAKEILNTGPVGFGWLNAASDIGSIVIVLWLTLHPLRKKQGQKLLLAVGGFGCCIILFALSKWFWLSFAALLTSGMLDGISVVVRGNILQLRTPDALRGRVMSVNSMFINSSNEIGQFESGVAAKLMGNVPSVVFGGCMTLAIVVFTWFKAPTLRKLEY